MEANEEIVQLNNKVQEQEEKLKEKEMKLRGYAMKNVDLKRKLQQFQQQGIFLQDHFKVDQLKR